MANTEKYNWKFMSLGGMTRVSIETGEDIAHLGELDQKLWTVLSCPTQGLEFDAKTLQLLDEDKDGKIRVNEIVAAAKWLTTVLNDPDLLLKSSDTLPLSGFNQENEEGKKLYDSAKQILANLGKADSDSITTADTADSVAIFAQTRFNGDGIVTVKSSDDAGIQNIITTAAATVGSSVDRSGDAGINADQLAAFYAACADYSAWQKAAEDDKENIFPYGSDTEAALAACEALKAKIADYYMRCKLVAFNSDSAAALDVKVSSIEAISANDLSTCSGEIANYPLARVSETQELPLTGINPAWQAAFSNLKALVLDKELAGKESMTEAEWNGILAKFGAYTAWKGAKKGEAVEGLGLEAVNAFLAENRAAEIEALIAEDKALESESNSIDSVDKLMRLYRDFYKLLRNYITMNDFYESYKGEKLAVFQCGQLYIEQRRLDLCIRVADMGKHGDMAGLSGMYILYCTCTNKIKGLTMNIAAVLTDGDVDNLRVGQNAIFYDRNGVDYDAVVTKIIDNPVSIRQAFWSPYRKLANTITERITKSAAEKDAKVNSDLTAKAKTTSIPTTEEEKKAAQETQKPPFDIAKFAGIFAAVGMAAGLLGSALTALVKPWYTIIIVFFALIFVISGPSMFLAWLKLRKRNLAPVLNANGWAINSKVLVNVKFGATLTKLAKYPKVNLASDPFAAKETPKWKKAVVAISCIVAVLGGIFCALWLTNKLEKCGIQSPKAKKEAKAIADSIAAAQPEVALEEVEAAPAEEVAE